MQLKSNLGVLVSLKNQLKIIDCPYLWYSDATFFCQIIFSLFTRIRVSQMAVKVLIKYLRSFFAEISSFSSSVEKSGSKYHNCFASTLFQLTLNWLEFLVNYVNHSLNFGSGYWPKPWTSLHPDWVLQSSCRQNNNHGKLGARFSKCFYFYLWSFSLRYKKTMQMNW